MRQCPTHLDGATINAPVRRFSAVSGSQAHTHASRCLPPDMEAMGEVMIQFGRRPEMGMTLAAVHAVHVFPKLPRKVARGGIADESRAAFHIVFMDGRASLCTVLVRRLYLEYIFLRLFDTNGPDHVFSLTTRPKSMAE